MCNHASAPWQPATGQTYILLAYKLDLGVVNSTGYKQKATSKIILTNNKKAIIK